MPIEVMRQLYAAANAKDSTTVKDILKSGVIPDCNGIHATCGLTNPPQLVALSDSSEEDEAYNHIAMLMENLRQQLLINKQRANTIEFLTKANEEASSHAFIATIQTEIAAEVAMSRQNEIQRQETEAAKLKEQAEKKQNELLLQQQSAESERLKHEQQLLVERQQAEQRRLQEIAATELAAKKQFESEQAKIAARLELDRPFGGLHHESHMRRRLHIAAINNDPKEITKLITEGATVDVPDSFNHTPLWYAACQSVHDESVKALLKGGAKVTKDITDTMARMKTGSKAGMASIVRNTLSKGC